MRGLHHITPRQREVAALVAQGCSNADIAEKLCISIVTAKRHVYALLTRLGLNRVQLAVWAIKMRLVSLDEIELPSVL